MNPTHARLAWGLAVMGTTLCVQAQPTSTTLHLRTLAATCAACHGTDGRAVPEAGIKGLRGATATNSPPGCGPFATAPGRPP